MNRRQALRFAAPSPRFVSFGLLSLALCWPLTLQAQRIVTTVAGLTRGAYGNGGAATAAYLGYPEGVAVDAAANFYISDSENCQIRKVDASTGIITAIAGTGQFGLVGDGQLGVNAQLAYPRRAAFDSLGNLYFADTGGEMVREVNASTVAGVGGYGYSGDGGAATQASLNSPIDVAVDSARNLYIADSINSVIRKVTRATGIITTVAGTHAFGYSGDGGPATEAQLFEPQGVAIDAKGNLYISDTNNNVIRMVSAATGIITTVVGDGAGGYSGDGGMAVDAMLADPAGIRFDLAGNLYIADSYSSVVRKVTASTGIISTVAGGAATQAELASPQDLAVDAVGNLYIADESNNRIRRVDSAGVISTVAGNGLNSPIDNGAAADAVPITIGYPNAVAADASGNIW